MGGVFSLFLIAYGEEDCPFLEGGDIYLTSYVSDRLFFLDGIIFFCSMEMTTADSRDGTLNEGFMLGRAGGNDELKRLVIPFVEFS